MDELRTTRTRPFATTALAGQSSTAGGGPPPSEAPLPSEGHLVGGQYRLTRLLGEGNFGKVWEAARLDIPEHRVALKMLSRSHFHGRNVERELVMLATVGHPNVVQLKDHGIEADYVWFTMPVYEGETLSTRLERGPLDFREAYDIFLPIARAVEALHALGLRHQDIKPDNIFLAQFGSQLHPVLLDLGVAAEKESTFVAGTALYAAPEQLAAILQQDELYPLTEKMDTYCFAATLLHALVGEKHFPGARALTRKQVQECHELRATDPLQSGAFLDLSVDIRTAFSEVFRRWMSLRPDDRPPMSEVADELEILLEPEKEADRAYEAAVARQKRSLLRTRMGAVLLLMLGLTVSVVALWKRQTLALASALSEARALGDENFDKLDTCIAAHTVTNKERRDLEEALREEKGLHEQTLAALAKEGDVCTAAVAEMTAARKTAKAERTQHEEELRAVDRACASAKAELRAEFEEARTAVETQRSRCELELKAAATELNREREERESCQGVTHSVPLPKLTDPASKSQTVLEPETQSIMPYSDETEASRPDSVGRPHATD